MGAAGKTVEMQGGHTVRQSVRKGRNNKVYTTKGARDRRLRLSADTAIQFYDVQDRLGYERASEAVDWLIDKAQGSIDKLFGTSSQQYEHLTYLGTQSGDQGDYLAQNMADRNAIGEAAYLQNYQNLAENSISISEYNFMENPMLFPHTCMVNNPPELSYIASHKNYKIEDACFTSPSSSMLQHAHMHSCQQTAEGGQISTMILFDSKLSSKSEENSLVPNPARSFLPSPVSDHNDNSSSVHNTSDLNSTTVKFLEAAHQAQAVISICPYKFKHIRSRE